MYEPAPTLTYAWDPDAPATPSARRARATSFDLGPHPADPLSLVHPAAANGDADAHQPGPHAFRQAVTGQEIWVYVGSGG